MLVNPKTLPVPVASALAALNRARERHQAQAYTVSAVLPHGEDYLIVLRDLHRGRPVYDTTLVKSSGRHMALSVSHRQRKEALAVLEAWAAFPQA